MTAGPGELALEGNQQEGQVRGHLTSGVTFHNKDDSSTHKNWLLKAENLVNPTGKTKVIFTTNWGSVLSLKK